MSKPIKGEEAHAFGLVDAIVSPEELVRTARCWALDIVEFRRPWIRSLYRTDKLEPLGEAREILKFARAQTQKRAPNLQHPLVCLDVIEEGIVSGPRAGLWKVSASMLLFSKSLSFNLVNVLTSKSPSYDKPSSYDLKLLPFLQEAKAFQTLLFSDTCKSLVHVFFAQRATSKVVLGLLSSFTLH